MTGFSFANIAKFKEYDKGKPQKAGNASGSKTAQSKEESKTEEQVQVTPKLNYDHSYMAKYLNKVMLSPYTMEFYNLDPTKQGGEDGSTEEKDYTNIIWVQMEDGIDETADKLAQRMSEFGDFNVFKDSQTTFFMEFYFLEPDVVPSQTVADLVTIMSNP